MQVLNALRPRGWLTLRELRLALPNRGNYFGVRWPEVAAVFWSGDARLTLADFSAFVNSQVVQAITMSPSPSPGAAPTTTLTGESEPDQAFTFPSEMPVFTSPPVAPSSYISSTYSAFEEDLDGGGINVTLPAVANVVSTTTTTSVAPTPTSSAPEKTLTDFDFDLDTEATTRRPRRSTSTSTASTASTTAEPQDWGAWGTTASTTTSTPSATSYDDCPPMPWAEPDVAAVAKALANATSRIHTSQHQTLTLVELGRALSRDYTAVAWPEVAAVFASANVTLSLPRFQSFIASCVWRNSNGSSVSVQRRRLVAADVEPHHHIASWPRVPKWPQNAHAASRRLQPTGAPAFEFALPSMLPPASASAHHEPFNTAHVHEVRLPLIDCITCQ